MKRRCYDAVELMNSAHERIHGCLFSEGNRDGEQPQIGLHFRRKEPAGGQTSSVNAVAVEHTMPQN